MSDMPAAAALFSEQHSHTRTLHQHVVVIAPVNGRRWLANVPVSRRQKRTRRAALTQTNLGLVGPLK